MKIAFAKPDLPSSGAVVVGVLEDLKLTASAASLDKLLKGALGRAIAASRFKGRPDDILPVLAPGGGDLSRVVLVGLGKPAAIDELAAQAMGGRIVAHLNTAGEKEAAVLVDEIAGAKIGPAALAAQIAYGARLRSYRFDKYRTTEKPDAKPTMKRLAIGAADLAGARKAFEPLDRIADGVFFTRDLVSEPPNVIHP